MHDWRLLKSGFQTGAMNMALDEALLSAVAKGASPPVLRFYRWRPATVTLGYAQSVARDIDLEVCQQAGLDVVRRSTGGRAVLHDNEVTYAVIAPSVSGLFGHSVLDSYRVISEVLQKALQQLGLPAKLVAGRPRGGQQHATKAVCFSAPSQYELVIGGRKVAGSAQKRHGQAFLQHGSIPLEMDLPLLGKVLKAERNAETAGSLDKVGWLNQWAGQPLTVAEVEACIVEEFSKAVGSPLQNSTLTADELDQAERLRCEKYAHADWNMMR
ncbi:MAG: lipoate--protein ligase family protein [Desulfuromonadales bacterium]|jgi:lipoate-protein ligase A